MSNLADEDSEWIRSIEASSSLHSADPDSGRKKDCCNQGDNSQRLRRKRKKGRRKARIAHSDSNPRTS
eukprot:2822012-Heterocapsa_arctica.AAC.1